MTVSKERIRASEPAARTLARTVSALGPLLENESKGKGKMIQEDKVGKDEENAREEKEGRRSGEAEESLSKVEKRK